MALGVALPKEGCPNAGLVVPPRPTPGAPMIEGLPKAALFAGSCHAPPNEVGLSAVGAGVLGAPKILQGLRQGKIQLVLL